MEFTDSESIRNLGREYREEIDPTLRFVRERIRQGFGMKAITNRLGSEGRKTKNGKTFDTTGISRILRNPAYIGKIRFRDHLFDATHEPIVSKSLWDIVQQRLQKKPQENKKIVDREYILSGILRCPKCGGAMVPTHSKGKRKDGSFRINHYYACNAYVNKGSNACRANNVPAGAVEAVVLKWLADALSGPFWRRKVIDTLQRRSDARLNPILANRKKAEENLEKLKEKQRELLLSYETGSLDKDTFQLEAVALQAHKDDLQCTLEASVQDAPVEATMSPAQIRLAFQDLHYVLTQTSGIDQKKLLRSLVTKVSLDKDRRVSGMELCFPWSPTESGLVTTVSLNLAEGANQV